MCEYSNVLQNPFTQQAPWLLSVFSQNCPVQVSHSDRWSIWNRSSDHLSILTGLLIICLIILYLQRRQQHLQSQRNLWIPAPIRTTSTTATTPSPSLIWTWRWPSTVWPSPPPTDIRVNSKRHCSNVILIKYINKNRSLRHLLFDYKKNMHV